MRFAIGAVLLVLAACGARTGLHGLDAGPDTDAVVRPRDAGPPPRSRDAGPPPRPRDTGPLPPPPDAGPLPLDAGMLDPSRDPTGIWVTPPGAERTRRMAVAFHRRRDGDVIGYFIGGGPGQQIVEAHSDLEGRLGVRHAYRDPGLARERVYDGMVDGDVITFRTEDGSAFELHRYREEVIESRLVIFQGLPSAPRLRYDFTAALALDGSVLAGGFTGRDSCVLNCGGGIREWRPVPGGLAIDFESTPCWVGTLGVRGAPSASGRFAMTDCTGLSNTADVLVRDTPGTRASDVLAILATLAEIADDLEAGRRFAVPYPPVRDDYLHRGTDASRLFAGWNDAIATAGALTVDVGRVRQIATLPAPEMLPRDLWVDQTVRFTYSFPLASDVNDTETADDALAHLAASGDGRWVEVGVNRR